MGQHENALAYVYSFFYSSFLSSPLSTQSKSKMGDGVRGIRSALIPCFFLLLLTTANSARGLVGMTRGSFALCV